MKRRLCAALTALALLSGCSNAAQQAYSNDNAACNAGDKAACERLPADQIAWNQEQASNAQKSDTAGKIAIGVLLLPILALAVVAAAQPQQPDIVIVRCRWGC
jgi:hypothetical protein